jgi:hypothetical protein
MDPDPDPTPDPTPFFIDYKDTNFFSSYFVLITFPQANIFSLKNLIFCQNFVLKFYFASLFQSVTHFYEKKKDPDPDPISD